MTNFHVGQKVVCIDSSVGFEQFLEIKEGEIYGSPGLARSNTTRRAVSSAFG